MRLLVCGGRTFDDRRLLGRALTAVNEETPITLIITGGARGADQLAEAWAAARQLPLMVFPAHWNMGKRAGPARNAWMLQFGQPDMVFAFPGGRGTEDMVERAVKAGLKVRR